MTYCCLFLKVCEPVSPLRLRVLTLILDSFSTHTHIRHKKTPDLFLASPLCFWDPVKTAADKQGASVRHRQEGLEGQMKGGRNADRQVGLEDVPSILASVIQTYNDPGELQQRGPGSRLAASCTSCSPICPKYTCFIRLCILIKSFIWLFQPIIHYTFRTHAHINLCQKFMYG